MCWSEQVSAVFAAFDAGVVLFLLVRRRRGDVGFAMIFLFIVVQEVAQFMLWHSGLSDNDTDPTSDDVCTLERRVWTWVAITSAILALPASMMAVATHSFRNSNLVKQEDMCTATPTRQKMEDLPQPAPTSLYPPSPYSSCWVKLKQLLVVGWVVVFGVFSIIVALIVTQHAKCATVGVRHHQVWPCAWAAKQAIGFAGSIVLALAYVLGIFIAITVGIMSDPELWFTVSVWVVIDAFASFVVLYSVYASTLEACSMWCWSAFLVGVILVARPWITVPSWHCAAKKMGWTAV